MRFRLDVIQAVLVLFGLSLHPAGGVGLQAQESFAPASVPSSTLSARVVPDGTPKTFFVRHDLVTLGIAAAATGVTTIFDKRIARWSQDSAVQGSSRTKVIKGLTHINETTLTAATILGYGVGRLTHSSMIADVSLHTGEAVVLTSAVSQLIRGPLGRTRPSVNIDDPYHFQFGRGFTHFDNRSFPSLHSATAFAAATAIAAEVHERNPDASWIVSPLLYAAAAIPGLTRIYLDQHWASDIVSGAFIGTMLGHRVVHYAHTHQRNKFDRALLGLSVVPDSRGGLAVSFSIQP